MPKLYSSREIIKILERKGIFKEKISQTLHMRGRCAT